LLDHPYEVSRRAREAASRLDASFNGGANAGAHAEVARRKKRR
jgi:hypothetical protein